MFANVGNPFGNPSLDTSDLDIRSATGSSRQFFEAEEIRAYFSRNFIEIAQASQSRDQIAEKGKAGKLSTPSSAYLVDANGIEIGQVISKSFIGAFQLDYISNILLDRGLNDDNTNLVADKKYTKLQHNWDVAYGVLTTKPIYGGGATAPGVLPATHNKEAFLGSYVWEYNRENFSGVHVAFLKGRAAAINKDVATMNEQALFIRKQLEITMAKAALGYLNKWRSGTDATKAHAIAEGIGFIYSLRFCELYGANEAFSERVLVELLGTPHNYWDLTADKIANAEKAIKAQFRL